MDTITFDHRRLFHGIAFHLRQRLLPPWRAFNVIAPHSLGRLARRLERQKATARVRRADWQSWSDAERVEWLLTMSNTRVVRIGDSGVGELIDANRFSVRHAPAPDADARAASSLDARPDGPG